MGVERRQLESLANRATAWALASGLMAVVAAGVSFATYEDAANNSNGGTYYIWWGPFVFGAWGAISNGIKASRFRALLRQAGPTTQVSSPTPVGIPPGLAGSAAVLADPDQQLMVQTSADYVKGPWARARRSDLTRGWLLLVQTPRGMRLKFNADRGTSWALYASMIHHVALVGSGPNVIVEVVFQHPDRDSEVTTVVGPRGRVREICAAIGHPIA
jgi:hypothetical protein